MSRVRSRTGRPPGGRPPPGRWGFTLVELVVALLVLEVMVLGAVAALHLGGIVANRARATEAALWEAGALADSIAAGRTDGTPRRVRPWGWVERVGSRVEARDPAGRLLVSLELPS